MNNRQTFSISSDQYARYRPLYPSELFKYLAGLVEHPGVAWDCATGSGQAAVLCAEYFQQVFASDISAAQIQQAYPHPSVVYCVSTAEAPAFKSHSFDLIMVAQALHWFKLDVFYAEVHRLLKPHGILAFWGYGFFSIDPRLDELLDECLLNIISPYWSKENRILQSGYRRVPLPFEEIKPTPSFELSLQWNLPQMLGYLSTWSAVKRHQVETKIDLLADLRSRMLPFWPEDEIKTIKMPLYLRAGKNAT